MHGAIGLPEAPIPPQRICKVTQGGEFEKEEPSAACSSAPQACLELSRVWVCFVLLVEGGWDRDAWRGLPQVPDHGPGSADSERGVQDVPMAGCHGWLRLGSLNLFCSSAVCVVDGVRWLVSWQSPPAKPAFVGDVKGLYR